MQCHSSRPALRFIIGHPALLLAFFVAFLCLTGAVQRVPAVDAAVLTALQPCASSIEPGATQTCQISTAAEVDVITLSGASGEAYLIRVAITAGSMRPQVRVANVDGETICQASSPYSPGAEIARCVLTGNGAHTISISDTAATRTGSYNLFVQRLASPVNVTPLTIGATHPSLIAAGAEAATFTLTGTTNEAYLLRMGVTAGDLRPSLRVIGQDGTVICAAVQPYASGAEIARCVLPQDGTFTVLAADTSAIKTGSFNLYLQRLTAPLGATALEFGSTLTATIQAGSEADAYTLTGTANDVYLLRMGVTAGALRPSLRVFNSDGSAMCQVVQPYALGAELSRCVLPQSGSFTVLATDSSATKTGSYNLYIQRLSAPVGAPELEWGATTAATVQMAAELDSYVVQAAANDVLLMRMAIAAGEMRPTLVVFDPDGVNICAASGPYSQGIELTRCLIPRDGAYLIMAGDTSATKTGSYSLYLQRLTAPVHSRVIVAGETLAGLIQAPAEADAFRWSAGANDRLRVTVAGTGGALRPGVRVFDPAGIKVCEALGPYSTSVEIADCFLPRSGVYTVVVGDSSATRTGSYSVGLTCLSSPCGSLYEAVIGPEGGRIIAGELQIDIPPGAFVAPTTIQVTPQTGTVVSSPDVQRVVRSFALLARGAENATVSTAAQPLTYTIRHGDLDLSAQGITASSLRLGLWSGAEQRWTLVGDGSSGASISTSSTSISDVALLIASATQEQNFVYLPMIQR